VGLGDLISSILTNGEGDAPSSDDLRAAAYEKMRILVERDIAAVPAGAQEDDPGPLTDWPENWANSALASAREAYRGLVISEKVTSSSGNVSYRVDWEGKAAYNERCGPILQNQMSGAARHLADLLNSIFDPDGE
jgi:hypothetical protein